MWVRVQVCMRRSAPYPTATATVFSLKQLAAFGCATETSRPFAHHRQSCNRCCLRCKDEKMALGLVVVLCLELASMALALSVLRLRRHFQRHAGRHYSARLSYARLLRQPLLQPLQLRKLSSLEVEAARRASPRPRNSCKCRLLLPRLSGLKVPLKCFSLRVQPHPRTLPFPGVAHHHQQCCGA